MEQKLSLGRRELDRRKFMLGSASLISASHLLHSATPVCSLTSEQEEGPYYVDYGKIRQDLTEGKPGIALRLRVRVVNAKTCVPVPKAALDIWHCDASGVYSGFTASSPDGGGGPEWPGFGPPPGGFAGPPPDRPPPIPRHGHGAVDESRFLRGLQVTDQDGAAEFITIYPGWYSGRAIHIHCKVHTNGHVSHTGQFFFPEDITESVAKIEPYAKRLRVYRTRQGEDPIFQDEHGVSGMMRLARMESRSDAGGFVAEVVVAVDPNANPQPVGFGRPR